MKSVDIQALSGQILAVLSSPGFFQPEPVVQNLHLVPEIVLEAMRPGWFTGQHPSRSVVISRLSDVYVTEEGLVFTKERELIAQTQAQHNAEECQRAYDRLPRGEVAEMLPEERSCLLLRKRGDHNYGHWIVELLPRLWMAEQVSSFECLVVPEVSGPMRAVIRDSVALSSVRYYDYLPLKNDEVRYFRNLTVVEGLTDHGVYMSPLCFDRTERMRGVVPSGSEPFRLYIDRPGSARHVVREERNFALLESYGFRVIDPAELTLSEQVKLFRNASCVIGVMGAGMTSIAFCTAGTKIGVLAPATMPDTFFSFIAGIRGLTYREIRGETQSGTSGWDVPFHISPESFEALLKSWMQ